MLRQLIARLASRNAPTMMAEGARTAAIKILRQHGIDAHFYLPAVGCEDDELAEALRLLGGRGYIMTTSDGSVVGKVAKATQSSNERAREARRRFYLVEK